MDLSRSDIDRIIAIGQEAGRLVLSMQANGLHNIDGKSNEIDLVTEADVASEALIRNALDRDFPGPGFWGEESNQPPDDEYYWLVDPIDGTVNYAHGIPYFAVNIALNQRDETRVAITLELPFGRVFWAAFGGGTWVRNHAGDDTRVHVNQIDRLRMAVISTGFPYTRAESRDNNRAEFAYLMPRCAGVRRMGSAAMDLAMVASSALTAHWECNLNPWDIAPGALLISEAGGMVTDYAGEPWTLRGRNFIASNGQPALHQALVDGIGAARRLLHNS